MEWKPYVSMVPDLEDNTIHLWRISLPFVGKTIEEMNDVLSPDERQRAANFHFDKHKRQYIVARSGLRYILSYYLNSLPKNITFSYTQYGKPYLEHSAFNFNLSHSDQCIVYAITQRCLIGVDVEKIDRHLHLPSLAREVFSDNEYELFLNLSAEEQVIAFYRGWTRKEAYLKAIGTGLSSSLKKIEVSFLPDAEPSVTKLSLESSHNLKLIEFVPLKEYMGAIAVEGQSPSLHCLDWNYSQW